MMEAFHATECLYVVDEGWVERTRYAYKSGDIVAISEPFAAVAEGRAAIDAALDRFRISTAGYQLLEHQRSSRPVEGAELVAQRFTSPRALFEITLFWPVGDVLWMFRVFGPQDSEPQCREAMAGFLESYESTEEA